MKVEFDMSLGYGSGFTGYTPSTAVKKLPFYLISSGVFHARKGYFTKRSGLKNYLLIRTLSGAGLLTYNNTEYTMRGGDFMLIDCFPPQYYRTDPDSEEWVFEFFHADGAGMPGVYELIRRTRGTVFSFPPPLAAVNIPDGLINAAADGTLAAGLKACAGLQAFFLGLLTEPAENAAPDGAQNKTVEKIIDYICDNFKAGLSLNKLAKVFYLSKFHLIRLFKQSTGITPHEFILNQRISHAKTLLVSTPLSVAEICYESGFNNLNNFTRCFKSVTGLPPSVYRRLV